MTQATVEHEEAYGGACGLPPHVRDCWRLQRSAAEEVRSVRRVHVRSAGRRSGEGDSELIAPHNK